MIVCGITGAAALGAIQAQKRYRWRQSFATLGLRPTPQRDWHGVYRGRALTIELHGQAVRVSARTLNPALLLDELHSTVPLPQTPWLSPLSEMQLTAFVQAPGEPERWSVHIHHHQVELACASVQPRQLRFLLDLTCDLAEGVDQFGEGR